MRSTTSGEDSRVHEGGHAKVGKGENKDHGNINWNGGGKILRQPWAPGNDAGRETGSTSLITIEMKCKAVVL